MSHLVPESRVNKNGVPVIKYVRASSKTSSTGILSRLIPTLSAGHRAAERERRTNLIGSLRKMLLAEREKDEKRSLERAQNTPDPVVQGRRIRQHYREFALHRRNDFEHYTETLERYSTDTLAIVMEVFKDSEGLQNFLRSAPEEDSCLKEYLTFRECNFPEAFLDTYLNDVRASTGINDLSEIERGTEAHGLVSAVFNVALEFGELRAEAFTQKARDARHSGGTSSREYVWKREAWVQDEISRKKMTRSLASVIVDYPDRTEDITNYLWDRELEPNDVDTDHLRLHLEADAPSLSDGIL